MDVEKIREEFPLLQREIKGKPVIYLDNAATSLKPKQVIEAIDHYYSNLSANIHRGLHKLSEAASKEYEEAHSKAANFINAKSEQEIVFTRNTTESLNLLMYSLLNKDYFQKGDEIIVSKMEHHSNLVPWQFLEKKIGIQLKFIELKDDFTLDMDDLNEKVSNKTKLISIVHASNTVATITPVREIEKIAHSVDALFAVDAAQSIPHTEVNVRELNADFLAFSSHKMLGPTGLGILYGKKELLQEMPPFLFGGDMIHSVELHNSTWNKLPYKFEAGTPNIAASFGLSAAIDYLQKIGMHKIREHGKRLTKYALNRMEEIGEIIVHCPKNVEKQGSIVLFDAKGIEAHDLALALDELENIAIRSGMLCAEPIVSSINPKGLARISLYFYNTEQEIDIFIESLKRIIESLK